MSSRQTPDEAAPLPGRFPRPVETRPGQIISLRSSEAEDSLEVLNRNDARFRALLSSLDDLVFEQDHEGRVLAVWTGQEKLLTAPVAELLGRSAAETLGEEVGSRIVRGIRLALESGRPQLVEYRLRVPAGVRWFQARLAPIRGSLGTSAVCALVRDVTDHKLAEQERDDAERRLRDRALRDALTGLPNRRFFFDRLARLLEAAGLRSESLAVLMMDVDSFKLINDTFGHAIGDDVLIETARRLQAATRDGDSVARLGGDEFAVIVPSADDDSVASLRSRLHELLEAPMVSRGRSLHVGLSIGVARFPSDATNADALVRVADSAMYEVKRSQKKGRPVRGSDDPSDQIPETSRNSPLRTS